MRKLIETIIYYLKFKENNENEMAVHAIHFDFYYCKQLSTMAALPAKAFADTCSPTNQGAATERWRRRGSFARSTVSHA
jgi:hypothetical protein